ncbi:DUF1553 domain-containing protein [Neorhodopirellula pilleata]|uniref:Xanthan lyase n=1 Tax=Neorhodopirellula pilleata TaxID=2714738 RepID=A0A5C6AX88_9BACT|nr:DUF1553 domain-containing protein [Neorhodopirellula pilleata]TWU03652.1 Xanthan lyase precursor [Neorhodopirellula pilleata]
MRLSRHWPVFGLLAFYAASMLIAGKRCHCDDTPSPRGQVFFETHIRPVLIEHCLECHSTDTEASGQLLLDSRSGWETGGDLGPAVIPGDPASSLLMRAIEYQDSDLQMPPDGKLDAETIEQFRDWIQDGAYDPREGNTAGRIQSTALPVERATEHWAYAPIKRPSVEDLPPAQSPIDRFVLAGLQSHDLQPEPIADDLALLRRMSFDLTGLPPTPEQIDAFVQDRSPEKWDVLLKSLLASPGYAETFARRWMDVARYAESITLRGFVLSEAWRYRDYLIHAYAEDRGFDQMIRDQIAGDLFGGNTLQERQKAATATAFLAMGNNNLEDQDKTKLEFDYIDEQLETIGRAFLAQTIGCARCHDHKFDPIPTADYYSLAGIFRSTISLEHANLSKWIEQPLPLDDDSVSHFEQLEDQANQLRSEVTILQKRVGKSKTKQSIRLRELPGIVIDDSDATLVGEWTQSQSVPGYVESGYLHDSHSGLGEKTATFEPSELPAGDYEVRLAYTPGTNRARAVQVQVFSANEAKTVRVNQRKTPPIDGIWTSLGTYPFEQNGQAFVLVSNNSADGHVIVDAVQFLPVGEVATRNDIVDETNDADELAKLDNLKKSLTNVEQQLAKRPKYLTILEGEPVDQIAIRVRGIVHHEGERVSRGFLSAIGRSEHWSSQIEGSGRRQLAHWLADPSNPLTARVYANRVWSWLMGEGLVATENNFGTTGDQPSHPELLDYLANELIESGWSTKHLVRMIVRSDAYRRRVGSQNGLAASVDPDNRLLWSAHLKRIPVESLRDAMLQVSGELDHTRFGPTIRTGTKADFNYRHESSRRSVYHPVLRNSLPPLYQVFDFADSSVSIGQRPRSTVATQSLVMLNHPWVIERARHAAKRFGSASFGESDETRIVSLLDRLFLSAYGRYPSSAEREMCETFLQPDDRLPDLVQSMFASVDFRYLE